MKSETIHPLAVVVSKKKPSEDECILVKERLVPFTNSDVLVYDKRIPRGSSPKVEGRNPGIDTNLAGLALWLDDKYTWKIVRDSLGQTCLVCIKPSFEEDC